MLFPDMQADAPESLRLRLSDAFFVWRREDELNFSKPLHLTADYGIIVRCGQEVPYEEDVIFASGGDDAQLVRRREDGGGDIRADRRYGHNSDFGRHGDD